MIEGLNNEGGTSTKYNTIMLVNNIQYNNCIQVQLYIYTSSIQIPKHFQSSISIYKLKKVLKKNFKVQFKSTGFEKNSKHFKIQLKSTKLEKTSKTNFKVSVPG